MALQPGQTILNGKYRILKLIGEGGMARVWLAEEPGFGGRRVALKEPLANQLDEQERQEMERRFRQEVKLAPQLEQARVPNVVRTYTVERLPDGTELLVMEYLEGESLAELIATHPRGLPVEQAVSITGDILQALAGFHRLPGAPIHRDVKPENILLDHQGRAYLSDLGLAQLPGVSGRSQLQGGPHPGTPLYMAPEQGRSPDPLTPAADLYALGCVLFEMLTGQRYKRVRPGTQAGALRSDLPGWLDEVLTKALAGDPWERYQSAEEMAAAFRAPASQGTRSVRAPAVPADESRANASPERASNRPLLWLGGTAVLTAAVIVVLVIFALASNSRQPSAINTPVSESRDPVQQTASPPTDTPVPNTPVSESTDPVQQTASSPTDTPVPEVLSPSGWIYFYSQDDIHENITYQVRAVSADGTEQVRLTQTASEIELSEYTPSWSPDGQWAVFEAYRNSYHGIYKMKADWSGGSFLTEDMDFDASWSPDGQWIAFSRMSQPGGSSYDVYKIKPDGSDVIALAQSQSLDEMGSWSPDGQWIAFFSNRDDDLEIYIMGQDGSQQTRLTYNKGPDVEPAWSPDGQWIAFQSERDGRSGIFKVRTDGSGVIQLTQGHGGRPAWSPDGQWIAFQSTRDNAENSEIYIMREDGSEVTRLTYDDIPDYNPLWSP